VIPITTEFIVASVNIRVAAARPKALPMADGQTIGKLRLPLPLTLRNFQA
jgi:hypothetical protein